MLGHYIHPRGHLSLGVFKLQEFPLDPKFGEHFSLIAFYTSYLIGLFRSFSTVGAQINNCTVKKQEWTCADGKNLKNYFLLMQKDNIQRICDQGEMSFRFLLRKIDRVTEISIWTWGKASAITLKPPLWNIS